MDTIELASKITFLIRPVLPLLIESARKGVDTIADRLRERDSLVTKEELLDSVWDTTADRLGERGSQVISRTWAKLLPQLKVRPAAWEAVEDAAAHPGDADAEAALRLQLRKLLSEDGELAAEMAGLQEELADEPRPVFAGGERSVAIGGDVFGSNIITGDRNIVKIPSPSN
jgi:hypothetical protein